ncbi:Piwi-domain-containing protein [Xylona heveae TC161]|uniref:Piwi-domain-containing protein n=1 Tax=Xylona heveae (strain CBS 132557 / TC161) TaxID=1328760 RepID=A0A165ISU1_XYLHT|nr:Piwi-domain-containing protein [Xylona heveae TC161]KZF25336.1 Piwi-domain-containing protein [Xylona heveae TC161]
MFPMELCYSVDAQFYKDVLEGQHNAEFIKWATAPAFARKSAIQKNVEVLQWNSQQILKQSGIAVSEKLMELKARVLPAPLPCYGTGTDPRPNETGRWNLRGKKLLKPCKIESWGMVFFPGQNAGGSIQTFGDALCYALAGAGISLPRRAPETLLGNPHGEIEKICVDIMSKASHAFQKMPNILIFVLPSRSERLYRALKNICEAKLGIASQVLCWDKAGRPRGQDQYLANVAIKVNVKLNGINHELKEEIFLKKRTMLMGADVSHPFPAQLRKNPPPPSFSALVATYDKACSAYTAIASCQEATTQMISDFRRMAQEVLERYKQKNNNLLPEQIFFFRDGLSESEFAQIMADEAQPLIDLCKEYAPRAPKITVIVAIKRHHTRIFPGTNVRGDKNGNVMPGTVLENSSGHDIFLVAHPGLQGTVRPTRYIVLKDENNLAADQFQRLVNNLCWSYARATTAVSLVPPVFYADQVCSRAKMHVRRMENGTLVLAPPQGNVKYSMYWQ